MSVILPFAALPAIESQKLGYFSVPVGTLQRLPQLIEPTLPSALACEKVKADLAGINAEGATMRGCDLSGATWHRANLTRCDLRGSDLSSLDPANVELQGAQIGWQQAVQLVTVLGLDVLPE